MKGKSIIYEDIMKQLTHDYDIEKVILYSLIGLQGLTRSLICIP